LKKSIQCAQSEKHQKRNCPCVRHEGIWESGCISPLLLDLGIRWLMSGLLHAPAALSRGKQPPPPCPFSKGSVDLRILPYVMLRRKTFYPHRIPIISPLCTPQYPLCYSKSIYLTFKCIRSLSSLLAYDLIS